MLHVNNGEDVNTAQRSAGKPWTRHSRRRQLTQTIRPDAPAEAGHAGILQQLQGAGQRHLQGRRSPLYLNAAGCSGPEVSSFTAASKSDFSATAELGPIHGSTNQCAENLN